MKYAERPTNSELRMDTYCTPHRCVEPMWLDAALRYQGRRGT
ncbi:hypothetical protein [Amycolatopsis tolypomycina]